jgi:hypothetical protein
VRQARERLRHRGVRLFHERRLASAGRMRLAAAGVVSPLRCLRAVPLASLSLLSMRAPPLARPRNDRGKPEIASITGA